MYLTCICLYPLLCRRSCWVCFATDEDDRSAQWVKPCRCRGTAKWVHQTCLQRWVDEKQKGNSTVKVACPQCNTEYLIFFPKLGKTPVELWKNKKTVLISSCWHQIALARHCCWCLVSFITHTDCLYLGHVCLSRPLLHLPWGAKVVITSAIDWWIIRLLWHPAKKKRGHWPGKWGSSGKFSRIYEI